MPQQTKRYLYFRGDGKTRVTNHVRTVRKQPTGTKVLVLYFSPTNPSHWMTVPGASEFVVMAGGLVQTFDLIRY